MAMAFAPMALLHPIEIEKPNVVSKSYPGFWEDLEKIGFVIYFSGRLIDDADKVQTSNTKILILH